MFLKIQFLKKSICYTYKKGLWVTSFIAANILVHVLCFSIALLDL